MLVYAIRHAESMVNANLADHADPELTPLGQTQAVALADHLAAAAPRAIYASPYRRAIRTAEPLARRLNLPIRLRHEICEFNPPNWEALKHFTPPVIRDLPSYCDVCGPDSDDDGSTGFPPFSETLRDVIARTRRFAAFLKDRWPAPDDAVVVVGHGLPVARLIDAWLTDQPGPAFRFVIDNAAIAALRYHKEVSSLICLNERTHLVNLPAPGASNFHGGGVVKQVLPGAHW